MIRRSAHPGKSLRLIGNLVNPLREKYSSSVFQKHVVISPHPASARGAYRDRHGRWKRDAVDVRMLKRGDAWTKAALADGKGVWS